MQGLTLSRAFYEEVAAPLLQRELPAYTDSLAVGLVGEGSECFGFDDDFSRDHDWGAGICIWCPEAVLPEVQPLVESAFDTMPRSFKNYPVRMAPELRNGRVGLFSVEGFYRRFINSSQPLSTWQQWYTVPEHYLAVCTNGEVFTDPSGEFSAFRNALLGYYPDDVLKKKLAARYGVMAQSGQYNLLRMLKRDDIAAALFALSRFVESTVGAMYLLHRRYMPFYKWAFHGLATLPDSKHIVDKLHRVLALNLVHGSAVVGQAEEVIEDVCVTMVRLLQEKGLTQDNEPWLMAQAEIVQGQIENPQIRNLPVLHGVCFS